MQRFLPYGRQLIDESDIAAVAATLREEIITRGRYVDDLEAALAERCAVSHVVAFQSGTAALQGAYFAAELSPNDRLYTTPNSFIATAGAALQRGACLVFVDIDRASGNLDLDQLAAVSNAPQSRGRAIIAPVHFSGIPVDMQRLSGAIRRPSTMVIEDGCHALGSCYRDGSPVGSCRWSDMTVFSFHPLKAITSGEGGAVTTNDASLARRLRLFRNNGIEKNSAYLTTGKAAPGYYEVQVLSGNHNVTDFQAALASSQLKKLDLFVEERRKLMRHYSSLLKGNPFIRLFGNDEEERTAYHLCVVQIDFAALSLSRELLMEQLQADGIGTQIHYIPIYRHPAVRQVVGDIQEYFPEMEAYYASALSLPLFYGLTSEEVDEVVAVLLSRLSPS